MFVTSCPECGDAVTVPSRARLGSHLRCPLCTAEYTLEDVLGRLPPSLQVVGEAEGDYAVGGAYHYAAIGSEDGDSAVATLVAPGDREEIGLADAEPRAERPSFEFGGAAAEAAPGKAITTKPRPKKKKANALAEVVKVVLGGAAAIPLAMAIFWYGFGTDPFGIAPYVAKYVPGIVPAKLAQGDSPSPTPQAPESKGKAQYVPPALNRQLPESPVSEPRTGGGKKKGSSGGIAPNPALENFQMPEPETPLTLPDPDAFSTPDPLTPSIDIDPLSLPDLSPAPIDPTPTEPTIDEPPPAASTAGLKNAPTYTVAELREAVDNAGKSLQAFQEGYEAADNTGKAKLNRELYKTLADLADRATFVDANDPEATNHLQAVRELLASQPDNAEVMNLVTRVGPAWVTSLKASARNTNGALVVGKVDAVAPQGEWFETRLVLEDSKKTPVSIVSTKDPTGYYETGDRLLVPGVIVESPSTDLTGYEGNQPRVLLASLTVNLE